MGVARRPGMGEAPPSPENFYIYLYVKYGQNLTSIYTRQSKKHKQNTFDIASDIKSYF